MQFRQNGQRDARRRRVLRDDMLTSPEVTHDETQAPEGREAAATPNVGYSTSVSVESQPRISCLIPTRPWTITVLVLAGLTVIAGLQAAFSNIFHGSGLPHKVVTALDVSAPGSVAAWFSSLLLSMAAVNAVLVYWLRSHKLDDYRACYRVWLWAAIGLTFAAIDASTGLHSIVGHLVANQFEVTWLQNPTINGIVFMTLVFGSLAVRLAFEIWASQLARSWSLLGAFGYLVAFFISIDVLAVEGVMLTAMAQSTAILVANLSITLVVASYCRYVHLDSQGTLKPRRVRGRERVVEDVPIDSKDTADEERAAEPTKRSPVKAAEDNASNRPLKTTKIKSRSIRCDSAHQVSGTAQTAKKLENPSPPDSAGDSAAMEGDSETGAKLSKSERRRLRKQIRRQKKMESG